MKQNQCGSSIAQTFRWVIETSVGFFFQFKNSISIKTDASKINF